MNIPAAPPPAHPQDRPSVYDLRIYDVAEGELGTLERVLRELAAPMMPDYGMKAVGFWAAPERNKLYQISQHESADVIKSNWDRFHADPRWQTGLRKRRQDRVVVKGVETISLVGIVGLPPLTDASAG